MSAFNIDSDKSLHGAARYNCRMSMAFKKLQWLRGKIADLVALGMMEAEPNPEYGSPVFVVEKPNNRGFRMGIDLRF